MATEAHLLWLREQGYRYLVVRRGGQWPFDENEAVAIQTAGGQTVRLQKEVREDEQEVLLYGHSPGREVKELAMTERFARTLEAGLQKIAEGLAKPRAEKRSEKRRERVGRLKEKSHGAGQHYAISWTLDEAGKKVTALTWEKQGVAGTQANHPGVYGLRSPELSGDEERLWRTYTMLTDLEALFRRLKSEWGLRSIFPSREDRSDGHLFITVLAYQCVPVIRTQLKAAGITDSWARLRELLTVQRRVTASLRRRDGRTLLIRKATVAESDWLKIYQALKLNPAPGGSQKMLA